MSNSRELDNRILLGIGRPRNDCAGFVRDHADGHMVLKKREFNCHCKAGDFEVGPHAESFGDGYGDPYNPYRQAFGRLKDGRVVICELHADYAEDPTSHLAAMEAAGAAREEGKC